MRQVRASTSRQWLSGWNRVLSEMSSGSARARSNSASQFSAIAAVVSVVANIPATIAVELVRGARDTPPAPEERGEDGRLLASRHSEDPDLPLRRASFFPEISMC